MVLQMSACGPQLPIASDAKNTNTELLMLSIELLFSVSEVSDQYM